MSKGLETNDSAPSLLKFLSPVLEPVWNNEPREDIRRSYPEGVMSSSGKQWHDFTDATSIVRHLQKYPKNSLIVSIFFMFLKLTLFIDHRKSGT